MGVLDARLKSHFDIISWPGKNRKLKLTGSPVGTLTGPSWYFGIGWWASAFVHLQHQVFEFRQLNF